MNADCMIGCSLGHLARAKGALVEHMGGTEAAGGPASRIGVLICNQLQLAGGWWTRPAGPEVQHRHRVIVVDLHDGA